MKVGNWPKCGLKTRFRPENGEMKELRGENAAFDTEIRRRIVPRGPFGPKTAKKLKNGILKKREIYFL